MTQSRAFEYEASDLFFFEGKKDPPQRLHEDGIGMSMTEIEQSKASPECVGAGTINSIDVSEKQGRHAVTFGLLEQGIPLGEGAA